MLKSFRLRLTAHIHHHHRRRCGGWGGRWRSFYAFCICFVSAWGRARKRGETENKSPRITAYTHINKLELKGEMTRLFICFFFRLWVVYVFVVCWRMVRLYTFPRHTFCGIKLSFSVIIPHCRGADNKGINFARSQLPVGAQKPKQWKQPNGVAPGWS